MNKQLKLDELVSRTYPLDDIKSVDDGAGEGESPQRDRHVSIKGTITREVMSGAYKFPRR